MLHPHSGPQTAQRSNPRLGDGTDRATCGDAGWVCSGQTCLCSHIDTFAWVLNIRSAGVRQPFADHHGQSLGYCVPQRHGRCCARSASPGSRQQVSLLWTGCQCVCEGKQPASVASAGTGHQPVQYSSAPWAYGPGPGWPSAQAKGCPSSPLVQQRGLTATQNTITTKIVGCKFSGWPLLTVPAKWARWPWQV